jgi:hypothetical protein
MWPREFGVHVAFPRGDHHGNQGRAIGAGAGLGEPALGDDRRIGIHEFDLQTVALVYHAGHIGPLALGHWRQHV